MEHLRNTYSPEMCTIAWAKMYEMIGTFNLLPEDSPALADPWEPGDGAKKAAMTVHLCEAPGERGRGRVVAWTRTWGVVAICGGDGVCVVGDVVAEGGSLCVCVCTCVCVCVCV